MLHVTGYIAQHRSEINANVRVGEVTIYRGIPAARPSKDEQIPDPIVGVNRDPSGDAWLDEVWQQIMWTDQYVETGGLYRQINDFMDESSYERELDRLNQRGQVAVRNAETAGGGQSTSGSGQESYGGQRGRGAGGAGGSGQQGEGGSGIGGIGAIDFPPVIIYGRRPR